MIINYEKADIIKSELTDYDIIAIFKLKDKTTIELSFSNLKNHEITIIDNSLNTRVKHYHDVFYINWLSSYTIKVDKVSSYIIKPILQHELIKL